MHNYHQYFNHANNSILIWCVPSVYHIHWTIFCFHDVRNHRISWFYVQGLFAYTGAPCFLHLVMISLTFYSYWPMWETLMNREWLLNTPLSHCSLFRFISRRRIAGSCGSFILLSYGFPHYFPQHLYLFLSLPTVYKGSWAEDNWHTKVDEDLTLYKEL